MYQSKLQNTATGKCIGIKVCKRRMRSDIQFSFICIEILKIDIDTKHLFTNPGVGLDP